MSAPRSANPAAASASRRGPCGRFLRAVLQLLLACAALPVDAGDLSKADIVRRFGPPLQVGDKLREVPAWPLSSELEPAAGPVAYAFESIDLAPIPGFEGTPINLLVTVDRQGAFIDVELLRQHEPVFLAGLGPAPLLEFLRQYAGKNLRQEITVSSPYGGARGGGAERVVLDGVTKATASVRIVNQTVLAAALAVARARLGFADTRQRGPPAQARADAYVPMSFAELLEQGLVGHRRLSNREVEALFRDSEAAGADEVAAREPEARFIDLYIAYLNPPTIGRALLGDAGYATLMAKVDPGQHLYWIAAAGRYAIVEEGFVPGTQPPRLALRQSDLPIELRDFAVDAVVPAGAPVFDASRVFRIGSHAGLDPAAPLALSLTITRAQGMVLQRLTQRSATLAYQPPARLFEFPPRPPPEWLLAWQGRWPDLVVITLALVLLSCVLARPAWVAVRPARLAWFRGGFLAFTLVYLGWYAQGQLSIVQITGAVKTLVAGQGLQSFLYDPVSLLLIAFTAISFVVWGRGTFCGWLCPFGALQEFIWKLARAAHLPVLRLPRPLLTGLGYAPYIILAGLVVAAGAAPLLAERLVEVEPFKTAITVGFNREAPHVLYALGLLALGAVHFKFFCRFVCPLGAAMLIGGRLRRFDWLRRRTECGQPCQRCRHACAYDAIADGGAILYDQCFQCLDCVGIYHDAERCAPIMLYRRKGRQVAVAALPPRR